ncbi:MAG: hypothetical protein ACKVUS_17790 [Saprospiraceae bacterium]
MRNRFFKFLLFNFLLTALPGRLNGEMLLPSMVENQAGYGLSTSAELQKTTVGKSKAKKWHKWFGPKKGRAIWGALVWIAVGILWLSAVGLLVWLAWLLVGNVPLAMLIGFVLYLLIGSLIFSIRDKKDKARRKKNAGPKK